MITYQSAYCQDCASPIWLQLFQTIIIHEQNKNFVQNLWNNHPKFLQGLNSSKSRFVYLPKFGPHVVFEHFLRTLDYLILVINKVIAGYMNITIPLLVIEIHFIWLSFLIAHVKLKSKMYSLTIEINT